MKYRSMLLSLLLLGQCSFPPPEPPAWFEGTIVDLTHPFNADTIYWPTSERFELRIDSRGMNPAGYYYEANSFSAAEHGGTHLDAPIHFFRGRWTADQIPLERLVGRASVVDVTEQSEADPDYQVAIDDLLGWEAEHGSLDEAPILLIRTGYSRFWPDAGRYLGTAERGESAVADLHFPGLSPTAARWLVEKGTIVAVGIDTASIDHGQSRQFETHQILFEANIFALENLAALDQVPPTGATVVALPMKIEGGSGGPLRAIAFLED